VGGEEGDLEKEVGLEHVDLVVEHQHQRAEACIVRCAKGHLLRSSEEEEGQELKHDGLANRANAGLLEALDNHAENDARSRTQVVVEGEVVAIVVDLVILSLFLHDLPIKDDEESESQSKLDQHKRKHPNPQHRVSEPGNRT